MHFQVETGMVVDVVSILHHVCNCCRGSWNGFAFVSAGCTVIQRTSCQDQVLFIEKWRLRLLFQHKQGCIG